MVDRKERIPHSYILVVQLLSISRPVMKFVFHEMVANDRMNFDLSNKVASCFDHSKEQGCDADANTRVYAVFDTGKDSHEYTSKVYNNHNRINSPELVDRVGRSVKIQYSVNNDCRQRRLRDVEENGR